MNSWKEVDEGCGWELAVSGRGGRELLTRATKVCVTMRETQHGAFSQSPMWRMATTTISVIRTQLDDGAVFCNATQRHGGLGRSGINQVPVFGA